MKYEVRVTNYEVVSGVKYECRGGMAATFKSGMGMCSIFGAHVRGLAFSNNVGALVALYFRLWAGADMRIARLWVSTVPAS